VHVDSLSIVKTMLAIERIFAPVWRT